MWCEINGSSPEVGTRVFGTPFLLDVRPNKYPENG
jgi:hypothetical protein